MKITELVNYIASNGGEVELPDGRKVQVTLVETANPFDTPDMIGKWVRYINEIEGVYTKNKWYKCLKDEKYKRYSFGIIDNYHKEDFTSYCISDSDNREKFLSRFDLANALDYNPEELVGKWYEGKQIEDLAYPSLDENPHFYFGEDYFLECSSIDLSKVTDAPPTKSLKWEDVVKEVKPNWYTDVDEVLKALNGVTYKNQVPTKSDAKSVLAYCQLLVVMKAANGEWKAGEGDEAYSIDWRRDNKLFLVGEWGLYTPAIYFRTRELAQQALKDNEQLFKEFYQIQ